MEKGKGTLMAMQVEGCPLVLPKYPTRTLRLALSGHHSGTVYMWKIHVVSEDHSGCCTVGHAMVSLDSVLEEMQCRLGEGTPASSPSMGSCWIRHSWPMNSIN